MQACSLHGTVQLWRKKEASEVTMVCSVCCYSSPFWRQGGAKPRRIVSSAAAESKGSLIVTGLLY